MRKEQIGSSLIQAVVEQIKRSPDLFVPNNEELQKIVNEREKADLELKEAGIIVIL